MVPYSPVHDILQLNDVRNYISFHSSFLFSSVGGRDGVVVRALASHQNGGPGFDSISGLSLCWLSTLLLGFFSRCSGFPPSAKTSIQLI